MNAYDNFNQLRLSETVSPKTSLVEAPKNDKNPSNNDTIAGMGFLLFLTLMIALIKWCDIRKASQEDFSKIPINHKTPCSKCRYFNNNSYIKCAVQPEKVMTKEAKDCQDYCP
ncbi:hypothetical protein Riv7116_1806 [Rivularia sp. PCC 7116]|jgi:hypothetical protein|uniref:hypothetical protein n=1 Tax=Rivularia sp. PCC 7116 TaxID=373994 RepID=UPI00029EE29D|nr:hypothetical protein [Rivularia sp. PCC 7116]AFY54349.1 hypothetical protein Riv7116_1806 [Rivularia sp. PCC 7116]